MTTKSMLATLLAAIAVFALAGGTALAGNDRVADSAAGYVYPNFWGATATNQQLHATGVHQLDGASVDIYVTQPYSTGTYLFPPNPNW